MLFGFEDQFALFDMTPVDNQFIQDYLPAARGDDVRVYLYGLMRCYHPEKEMTLSRMGTELGMTEEEILKAYRYWERKRLVRRVSDDPPAWRYISLRRGLTAGAETVDPEYEAFVDSVYGVFDHGRQLHGAEIRTCYEWVEELKLTEEAVLMLLKHMEQSRGKNFTIKSAEQVALQMAEEGIRTAEEAEDFLTRDQKIHEGTKAILRRMGQRNPPSEDQMALYRKWTKDWGFTPEAISEACAETAKGTPTMGYLDGILRRMHERAGEGASIGVQGVHQEQREQERLRKVLDTLGSGNMTAENLKTMARLRENASEELILLAARECGRTGGRLRDVEKMLASWREKGIVTVPEAEKYIRAFRAQSELLLELRKTWGLDQRMGKKDREMVGLWESELGFAPEAILLAAEAAAGAVRPMPYLDKILRDYAGRNIRTTEQIRKELEERKRRNAASAGEKPGPGRQIAAQQYSQRDYSGPEETMEEVLARLRGEGTDA